MSVCVLCECVCMRLCVCLSVSVCVCVRAWMRAHECVYVHSHLY